MDLFDLKVQRKELLCCWKIAEVIGEKLSQAGVKEVRVVVKGAGSGREAAIRSFCSFCIELTSIEDQTPSHTMDQNLKTKKNIELFKIYGRKTSQKTNTTNKSQIERKRKTNLSEYGIQMRENKNQKKIMEFLKTICLHMLNMHKNLL